MRTVFHTNAFIRGLLLFTLFLVWKGGVCCKVEHEKDFGGRWISAKQSFNFVSVLPESSIHLKSGSQGNIEFFSDKEKELTGDKFDVDAIHKALQTHVKAAQKEASDHNVVVAGLTFIFSDGQEHHAVYSTLKEGNAVLSFISGSVEKNYASPAGYKFVAASDTYKPSDLLDAFGKRVTLSSSLSLVPKSFCENWQNGQAALVIQAKKRLFSQLQEESPPSTQAPPSTVPQLLEALHTTVKAELSQSNEHYGSSTDSEQYFLKYLAENLLIKRAPLNRPPAGKCSDLIWQYGEIQRKRSGDDLQKNFRADENVGLKIAQDIARYKAKKEIGFFIHLHSTHELCCCCSHSIATELRDGFLKEVETCFPVLGIFASCSQKIEHKSATPSLQRPGIGETFLDPSHYVESLLDLASIRQEGVFVQKAI